MTPLERVQEYIKSKQAVVTLQHIAAQREVQSASDKFQLTLAQTKERLLRNALDSLQDLTIIINHSKKRDKGFQHASSVGNNPQG